MKKGSEIREPEGNVRSFLRDRFAKGEREGFYNNVWSDKCIRSNQLTKDSSRSSHPRVHKIDSASVQKDVRWIFVIFYLFI